MVSYYSPILTSLEAVPSAVSAACYTVHYFYLGTLLRTSKRVSIGHQSITSSLSLVALYQWHGNCVDENMHPIHHSCQLPNQIHQRIKYVDYTFTCPAGSDKSIENLHLACPLACRITTHMRKEAFLC